MAKNSAGLPTLLVAGGILITVDELMHGTIAPGRYFGLIAAFLGLSFISSFQPEFALMLAWLFFLALLLQRGGRVFAGVAKKAKEAK